MLEIKEKLNFNKINEAAYASESDLAYNLLDYLKPHGLEKNFTPYAKGLRGVGHGVGLDVVERPNLSSDSDFNISSGMTLAIKLDLHGLVGGGYRIEIVVAITENGVKPLNKLILEEPNDFTIIRK